MVISNCTSYIAIPIVCDSPTAGWVVGCVCSSLNNFGEILEVDFAKGCVVKVGRRLPLVVYRGAGLDALLPQR